MSFTEDLINSLGTYLGGTAELTWWLTGAYSENEFGIYALTAPIGPRSVTIRPFAGDDAYSFGDSVVSIQLEFRGAPVEVLRAQDAVFDRLQGFPGGTLGLVQVQSITRIPGAPLGLDEAGNSRVTDNYDLAVYRPSTHRD